MSIMGFQANQFKIIEGHKALDIWRVSLWDFKTMQTLTKTSLFGSWHCVTCWGQIRSWTFWDRMQLVKYTYVNWVLRHLKPSFVLPLMLRRVPIKESQTFFSTCMMSIQCLTSRSDQYGRSKNTDFFFPYVCIRRWFFLCDFLYIFMISFTRSWNSLPGDGLGAVSCS